MFLSNRASNFGILFAMVAVLVGFTLIVIGMLKIINVLSIETIGDKTKKVSKGQRKIKYKATYWWPEATATKSSYQN